MPIRTKTLILRLSVAFSLCATLAACKDRPQTPAIPTPAQQSSLSAVKTDEHGKPTKGWVCDMACEGCKLFKGPGTCPVCRMDLRTYEDVPFQARLELVKTPIIGEPIELKLSLLDPAGCETDLGKLIPGPLNTLMNAAVVSSDARQAASQATATPSADGRSFRIESAASHPLGRHQLVCVFDVYGLGPRLVSASFNVGSGASPITSAPPKPEYVDPVVIFGHVVKDVPAAGADVAYTLTHMTEDTVLSTLRFAIVRSDLNYAEVGVQDTTRNGNPTRTTKVVPVPTPGDYRVLIWAQTDLDSVQFQTAEFHFDERKPE